MNRSFRLTRRAEDSLIDIALWTNETFGQRQADIYEAEIIERCEAIAHGEAVSQSCAVLIEEPNDLRYARAGGHYLVFIEGPGEIIIVDILHGRSDLARHVAALSSLQDGEV